MEDKETSDKLLYLLDGLSQNEYNNTFVNDDIVTDNNQTQTVHVANTDMNTANDNNKDNNNNVAMINNVNIAKSILSQHNSVISIPSTLQRAIDLQNEQLGITEPQNDKSNINISSTNDNVTSRKRRPSDSINNISSNSSVSSLSSTNKRKSVSKTIKYNTTDCIDDSNQYVISELIKSSKNNENDSFKLGTETIKLNTLSITDVSSEQTGERVFHYPSGQYYTISKDSIPTFHIPKQIFKSPIDFFNKVSDIGQKYGCIKLKFIDNDNDANTKNCSSRVPNNQISKINFESFSFKCRQQKMTSKKVINESILSFYHDLYRFYTTNYNKRFEFDTLPKVDGKFISLYSLYRLVQKNGGYERVTKDKKWRLVEKRLNYAYNEVEGLKIEDIYKNFLLDFEQSDFSINHTCKNKSSSPVNRNKTENTIEAVYELCSIGTDYPRIKDMKIAKHLNSNDQITIDIKEFQIQVQNPFIAQWQSWFPLYDCDKYVNPVSKAFNIKDYINLSQEILQEIFIKYYHIFTKNTDNVRSLDVDQFEKLYFDILESNDLDLTIFTGSRLSSLNHKINLEIPQTSEDNLQKKSHRWNLANVPLDSQSCFRYLNFDKGDYTSSKYDFGMLCSVSGWSINDTYLPSVDYQHLGAPKIWYVIPPEDMEKFEKYLQSSNNLINYGNSNLNNEILKNSKFVDSDIYEYFKIDEIKNISNTFVDRLSTYENFNLTGNSNTNEVNIVALMDQQLQIKPSHLRENGIRVYRVLQETGSYIFKYPKCYSSTLGTDFYFSESAYFLPKSMPFEYLNDGGHWLALNNCLPGINYPLFLANIIQSSKDQCLIEKTKHHLSNMVKVELDERSEVFKHFPNLEVVENRFDYISDFSLKPTGFSKVEIKYKNTVMTLSLSEFLNNLDFSDNNNCSLFDVPLSCIHIRVHLYYRDDSLLSLVDNTDNSLISNNSSNPLLSMTLEEKFSMMLAEKYDNERIPLNVIENLLEETTAYDDYYYRIKDLIDKTYLSINKCKEMLFKFNSYLELSKPNLEEFDKNPLTILNESPLAMIVTKFNQLVEKLMQSSITSPEIEYMIQLYKICQEFKSKVEIAVDSNKLKLLEKAYLQSFEIPLDHNYCQILIKSICRFKWSDVYYELFVSFDISNSLIARSLTFLYDFWNYGLKFCQEEDIPKLIKVKERILLCQDIFGKVQIIIDKSRKNQMISINDIDSIVVQIDKKRLPIPINLKKTLIMISGCIQDTISKENPFTSQLSGNKEFVNKVDGYIRGNSIKSFQYFPRFNGSKEDTRINIKEAQGKPSLADRVADYKAWYSEMRRITNGQSIGNILKSAKRTLDLTRDKYVETEKESSSLEALYCFCREEEGVKTMIQCDICKEWYHISCIGGEDWNVSNDENTVFVCPICDINGNTVIHKPDAVNFGDLKRNILDIVYLDVIPDKKILQQYFELYKVALVFRNSMYEVLFKDGDINKDVPISLIKYYLKKAEKSKIEFIDLVGPLKRYCHSLDKPQYELYTKAKKTIITV